MSGTRRCLGPVRHIQLAVDAGGMGLNSTWGDNKLPGDLLVGLPHCKQAENLQLTPAQWLDQSLSFVF